MPLQFAGGLIDFLVILSFWRSINIRNIPYKSATICNFAAYSLILCSDMEHLFLKIKAD